MLLEMVAQWQQACIRKERIRIDGTCNAQLFSHHPYSQLSVVEYELHDARKISYELLIVYCPSTYRVFCKI